MPERIHAIGTLTLTVVGEYTEAELRAKLAMNDLTWIADACDRGDLAHKLQLDTIKKLDEYDLPKALEMIDVHPEWFGPPQTAEAAAEKALDEATRITAAACGKWTAVDMESALNVYEEKPEKDLRQMNYDMLDVSSSLRAMGLPTAEIDKERTRVFAALNYHVSLRKIVEEQG